MDKEDRFPFEGDSTLNMNRKTVSEVLEMSSTGYGLESVMEPKKGNQDAKAENNKL